MECDLFSIQGTRVTLTIQQFDYMNHQNLLVFPRSPR